MITVSDKALQRLNEALMSKEVAAYIRVHVGRGWGGITYDLSLDETARTKDVVIEARGVRFLVEERNRDFVDGLEIDVRDHFGRDSLLAFNRNFGGGCW